MMDSDGVAVIPRSCCRICLAAEKTLLSLETAIELLDGSKLTCLQMFSNFTGLEEPPEEVSTDLPRKICISCFSELNNCYKFQRKAIDAFHRLFKITSVEVVAEQEQEVAHDEDGSKQEDAAAGPETEEEYEILVEVEDDNLKIESTSAEEVAQQPEETIEEEEKVTEECNEEYLEVLECDDKGLVDLQENLAELEEPTPNENDEEVVGIEIQQQKLEVESQIIDESSQQTFNGSFICSICSKRFASRKTLRQHGRVHQDSSARRFRCDHCSKSFNYSHHLKIHEMIHSKQKPFSCGTCGKQFATRDRLKNHEFQHKDRFEHGCPLCECSFRTKKALKMHTILKHDAAVDKFEPIICSKCGKELFSQSAASAHFKATACDLPQATPEKRGGRKSKLQKPPVDCIDCLANFPSRAELLEHRAEVHENRSHTCEVCGKRFLQAIVLSRHMKTHTGERTYSCEQCPKSFAQLATLQNHMRSHSPSQQFQCSVCPKRYKFLASLRNHVRASHDEVEGEEV